jgi:GNAT superfamily N-acetyltransferase
VGEIALSLLDNAVWNSLTGHQAKFAAGTGDVRRYAPGFSPILGFADQSAPDFSSLAAICRPGESFYTDGWSGPVPEDWTLEAESTMFKMVWEGQVPEDAEAPGAVELGPEHAEAALELALLTNPGPFGIRTIELGDYFGYFEGSRLIAMAGERMWAGPFREISGVCTHPDYQGRGLARKLMAKLIKREVERGEIPFLHVMSANALARGLYKRMGFYDYLESPVRVIRRTR